MSQPQLLLTVGQIARRLQTRVHRVEYVIRSRRIKASGWAGRARLFRSRAGAHRKRNQADGFQPRKIVASDKTRARRCCHLATRGGVSAFVDPVWGSHNLAACGVSGEHVGPFAACGGFWKLIP